MGIARPQFTGSRGTRRRQSQAGGGGGGNAWKDWTELDLSAIGSDWITILGSGGTSCSATATHSGGVLTVNFPGTGSAYNIRETGSTHNGLWLIKKIHLDPWANQATPAGQPAYQLQPESTLLKVMMTFPDTTHGPIDGVAGTGGSGQQGGSNISAGCGLALYGSDQSGNPGLPGADSFCGAYVYKNTTTVTNSSSSGNTFRAGSSSYNIKLNTNYSSILWKGQSGASSSDCFDSIIFHAGFNTVKGPTSGVQVLQGGGYSSTTPFGDMVAPAYSYAGNSSKISNGKYLHLAMWFGAETNSVRGGSIKISSLKYVLQPLAARADLE